MSYFEESKIWAEGLKPTDVFVTDSFIITRNATGISIGSEVTGSVSRNWLLRYTEERCPSWWPGWLRRLMTRRRYVRLLRRWLREGEASSEGEDA